MESIIVIDRFKEAQLTWSFFVLQGVKAIGDISIYLFSYLTRPLKYCFQCFIR